MDPVAAKQFLISKVVEQADLERKPLCEVETKMLYFSQVHASLPDISGINARFERECDPDEYEEMITGLFRRARQRDRELSTVQAGQWDESIDALKNEDHYILVMLHAAFPEYGRLISPSHHVRDYVIYIAVGIALVVIIVGLALWRSP